MDQKKDILYTPVAMGRRSAPNRLTAQAMEISAAGDGGGVSDAHMERYRQLGTGGWGVVFVEAVSVTGRHLARKRGLVLSRENLTGFRRLVASFREAGGGGLVLFQLSHAGRLCGSFSRPVGVYRENDGIPVLTEGEIDETVDLFAEAVRLSHEAGADGVDIKACHGYLGGEMLRPRNDRGDKYGGSPGNRSRFIAAIIREARKISGDFIVGTRISFYEGIRGGCGTGSGQGYIEEPDDMYALLDHIVQAGADFINVSAGVPVRTPRLTRPQQANSFDMFHHFRYAAMVKRRFPGLTVIGSAYSVGRERAAEYARDNITRGYADMAGFGRQSLADPLFPRRLADGGSDIRYCTLCGGCSRLLKEQKPVYCIVHPGYGPVSGK